MSFFLWAIMVAPLAFCMPRGREPDPFLMMLFSPTPLPATSSPSTFVLDSPDPFEEKPVDCENRKNGIYAVASCSQRYVECWEGKAQNFTCASGRYFSANKYNCELKKDALDCTVMTADNMCLFKGTGMHGIGCNNQYNICFDGKLVARDTCPEGEFYDEETNRCCPKEEVTACGGTSDAFCKNKEDGNYGKGCNSLFYVCLKGRTKMLSCLKGAHFDEKANSCRPQEEVAACISSPTPNE